MHGVGGAVCVCGSEPDPVAVPLGVAEDVPSDSVGAVVVRPQGQGRRPYYRNKSLNTAAALSSNGPLELRFEISAINSDFGPLQ